MKTLLSDPSQILGNMSKGFPNSLTVDCLYPKRTDSRVYLSENQDGTLTYKPVRKRRVNIPPFQVPLLVPLCSVKMCILVQSCAGPKGGVSG